mgnify:FL=1
MIRITTIVIEENIYGEDEQKPSDEHECAKRTG